MLGRDPILFFAIRRVKEVGLVQLAFLDLLFLCIGTREAYRKV